MLKLQPPPKKPSQKKRPPLLLRPKRRLPKKKLRRPTRRKLRRLPRRKPRRPPRRRRLMMKSQWTPPLSRLIHPLLPMPPRTLSHKPQSFTIKSLPSMKTSHNTSPLKMLTTQTQWDQWSKTRSPKSRMPQSRPPRRETTEHKGTLLESWCPF